MCLIDFVHDPVFVDDIQFFALHAFDFSYFLKIDQAVRLSSRLG